MNCSAESIEWAVERFQAGTEPESAFRILFFCYDPVLRRLFGRRGTPREDCCDLTQWTLLQVYKSLPDFRRESSFHTWIHRIALNFHRRWKNKMVHHRSREVTLEPTDPEQPASRLELEDDAPSPAETLIAREHKHRLRQCLDSLPARQRQCFVLHTYHHLSYREIASTMRIKVGTVGAALSQARANLARCLGSDSPEPAESAPRGK